MIHDLKRQGLSVSAIARQVGLDRKTVRKHLSGGVKVPVYLLTGPTHHTRTYVTDHTEPRRNIVEHLGDRLVDIHRRTRTAGDASAG